METDSESLAFDPWYSTSEAVGARLCFFGFFGEGSPSSKFVYYEILGIRWKIMEMGGLTVVIAAAAFRLAPRPIFSFSSSSFCLDCSSNFAQKSSSP